MDLSALPQVRMRLVGTDGNAFVILGKFKESAKRQGWDNASISAVLDQATSGDYNNLLHTISQYVDDTSVSEIMYHSEDETEWEEENEW